MRQFNRDQAIVNTMNQFKPQAVSGIDWANALENYNDAYNKAQDQQKQQDLADALIGGDEKQILAARAAYDPVGTANYLDQQQQQQQAREWALADAAQRLLNSNGEAVDILTSPLYQQVIGNILTGSVKGGGNNIRTMLAQDIARELLGENDGQDKKSK